MTTSHPPVTSTVFNQFAKIVSNCALDLQAITVEFTGQVNTIGLASLTVNEAVQLTGASQLLVTVNNTVLLPPHELGAPLLLLKSTGLHPPLVETLANQFANLVSIADWDWQSASITLTGQVNTTAGAFTTAKDAEHVIAGSHELVTVKITVVEPPHADGAPVLLFNMVALQPPLELALAIHALNNELIVACD